MKPPQTGHPHNGNGDNGNPPPDLPIFGVGVEWNSADPPPNDACSFVALPSTYYIATQVIIEANAVGYRPPPYVAAFDVLFNKGNADTKAVHWWHPEIVPGGESLQWIDSVDLMYFVGHGTLQSTALSLASTDGHCHVWYDYMRLGVQSLRWLVLDLCDGVSDDIDVLKTWCKPTRGDSGHPNQTLHVLCTFAGVEYPNNIERGANFISAIAVGTPISSAWLDAAFEPGMKPIAIAFGSDDADALNRLNTETLRNAPSGPVSSNSLQWFCRQ
jgi:hypothetical protein